MKKTAALFVLSMFLSFLFSYCNKEEDNSTQPAAPVCDQTCQDENVAYGFVDVFWFLWNQNIAGQPAGAKDLTVNGPQGGNVHITGNTAVSSSTGINTLHLVFEFSNCKGIKDKYNLIFNGTMSADGTFSTTHYALTYASNQLNYNGTVGKDDWVTQVDGSCTVTINQTLSTVTGTICGRTFSY
jgi:hypothetical protein